MPSNSPPVTDSETWSRLDHFEEDVCAKVRIALLEDFRVQDFLINAAELNPNESLGYWRILSDLERLSDGFLTGQQGHLLCERLRDADAGRRPMALDGVLTLWGAMPPASARSGTARDGRRRWPADATVQRVTSALLARFPEPRVGGEDAPGATAVEADDYAGEGLRPSSVKVARLRLRRHLPQND